MADEIQIQNPELPSSSETDRLKSSFTAAQEAVKNEADPAPVEAQEVKKPEAETNAGEQVIPDQFLTEKKEPAQQQEEPLVSDEVRNQLPKGKARESFAKLEAAAKAKIDAMAKELSELRSKPAPSGNTEELEKKHKEAQDRVTALTQELERVAFERSPKFQRYGSEEKAELDSAKSYLEGSEISPAIIDAAAATNGAARIKMLRESGMDGETIAILAPYLARVDALRRERDGQLATWKETSTQDAALAQQQAEKVEAQRQQQEKRVFDDVMGKLKDLPAFTRVEGQDKWNALVDANFKEAEDFAFGRKPLDQLFEMGARGAAQRTTELMNGELTKQVQALKAENAKLKATQPTIGTPTSADVTPKKEGKQDEPERWRQTFNAAKEKLTAA